MVPPYESHVLYWFIQRKYVNFCVCSRAFIFGNNHHLELLYRFSFFIGALDKNGSTQEITCFILPHSLVNLQGKCYDVEF